MTGQNAIRRLTGPESMPVWRGCLWAMFCTLGWTAMAQAEPALSDDESADHLGVGQIVVAPATTTSPDRPIGQQLYLALTQKTEASRVAPLLRQAIADAARPCHRATAWQLSTNLPQNYTVKVKCTSIRPYAVTVNQTGQLRIGGGDGSVPSMVPEDGPIITVDGEAAEDFALLHSRENTPSPEGPAVSPRPGPLPAPAPTVGTVAPPATEEVHGIEAVSGIDRWLLVVAVLGAMALLGGWYRAYRRSQLQPRFRGPPVQGKFSSDAKDELIAVSIEVSPGIFQHPYGWFIAQGPRGKRRLFKRLIWATCYRNFGWKIREIT